MSVPTQYVFIVFWYNKYVKANPTNPIPANQFQSVPPGGWGSWTASHNVDWLVGAIHAKPKFVLLGVRDDIRAQAMNAGTGKNQCVIGMEVLLLLSCGYTPRAPNHTAAVGTAYGGGVLVFDPPTGPAVFDQQLLIDAQTRDLHNAYENGGFWTKARYTLYNSVVSRG